VFRSVLDEVFNRHGYFDVERWLRTEFDTIDCSGLDAESDDPARYCQAEKIRPDWVGSP
jgi:hypothetical protein